MPPKSKGQTIQLRDLQRMAYESGQGLESILPSQSQGLERIDSQNSNRSGNRNFSSKYETDEKIAQLETDWRSGRDNGDHYHSMKPNRDKYRGDTDEINNTNWRSDIGRSTEKPKVELDFRRGVSTTSSRSYNNAIESNSINLNWRDNSNSNQNSSSFGGRFVRESSNKVHIDDRPEYLKNRFKKKVESSINEVDQLTQKLGISESKPSTSQNDVVNNSNVNNKPQAIQTTKNEKKPKPVVVKKPQSTKENKKFEDSEVNLLFWEIKDTSKIDLFENEFWRCLIGEFPKENSTPPNFFSPNSYLPPNNEKIIQFMQIIEKSIDSSDLESLTYIAKVSHILTIMTASLRCFDDVLLMIQSMNPISVKLIDICRVGQSMAKLYILIESQRMANVIGNPKIDHVTSVLEALWLAFLKSKLIGKDIFNLWLNKTYTLAEESKLGRKNALFEVGLIIFKGRLDLDVH